MPWIAVDKRGHRLFKWPWRFYIRHPKKKPQPIDLTVEQPLSMFDDVNLKLIPRNAPAVAGYVGGRWPTYPQVVKQWPQAHHLSIAVFASEDADCLDVEPGDATIAQAPGWVKRQHKRGNPKPVLYTSASWGQKLVDACTNAGLKYGKDYMWWSAHYTFNPHYCGPGCGFGIKETAHATQWTDQALGRSLDQSLCSPGFFPAKAPTV